MPIPNDGCETTKTDMASYIMALLTVYWICDLIGHPNLKLLDQEDCGQSFADRIIGGTQASLGQYPWLALLGYQIVPNDPTAVIYECGGSIISDRYILTASHCSPEHIKLPLLHVTLGEYNISSDIDCVNGVCAPPPQVIKVEEFICHPEYNKYFHNDICLLRLAKPIIRNDYVQPICLPVYEIFRNQDFADVRMEVAGWGITDIVTRKTSNVLMTLRVPAVSHNTCVKVYSKMVPVIDGQMCAGGVIGHDSCGGDSGGPLMKAFSLDGPPRYFVIGIVSFGPARCATTTDPAIYTKVSEYMVWILDKMRP